MAAPLAKPLPQVVAVPEPTVKHLAQTLLPCSNPLIGVRAVKAAVKSLTVTLNHRFNILRTARPALYLEHLDPCVHHLVHKMNGLEVFRRHYILIVNLQLLASLTVSHSIGPAAYLHTRATVSGACSLMQAQIALAAHSHTESTVAEHLYANFLPLRTAYIVTFYGLGDAFHLLQIQFTGKHHHIGVLSIEPESLHI